MIRSVIRARAGFGALALLTALAVPLAAQTGEQLEPTDETDATRVATRGAVFLNLEVGPRAMGMAGAYSAMASGIPALYYNVAATAFDDETRLGFTLSELYADLDIQHLFFGLILPVGVNRFAVSVNQLNSGDITRTTAEFPDGGDPQFGATFQWTATAVGLHYSRLITDRLGIGFTGKFITEGIEGARAEFVAADLSVTFLTGLYGTRLAAALMNVGTESRMDGSLTQTRIDQTGSNANIFPTRRILDAGFGTQQVELPTGFRFGLSADLMGTPTSLLGTAPDHGLMASLDLSDRTDSPLQPAIGFEYNYREIVFARLGKRWPNEDQISHDFDHFLAAGFGVAIPVSDRQIMLDYSYGHVGALDNVQSFAIELVF